MNRRGFFTKIACALATVGLGTTVIAQEGHPNYLRGIATKLKPQIFYATKVAKLKREELFELGRPVDTQKWIDYQISPEALEDMKAWADAIDPADAQEILYGKTIVNMIEAEEVNVSS